MFHCCKNTLHPLPLLSWKFCWYGLRHMHEISFLVFAAIRNRSRKAHTHVFGNLNYSNIDWPNLRSHTRNLNNCLTALFVFLFIQLDGTPARVFAILNLVLCSATETVRSTTCIDGFSDNRLVQVIACLIARAISYENTNLFRVKLWRHLWIPATLFRALASKCLLRSVNDNWTSKKMQLAPSHIPRISLRVNIPKP